MQRDGVTVELTWEVIHEDVETMVATHRSTLNVDDHGTTHTITEDHTMRVWTYADIQRLVAASGCFTIEAIYGEEHEPVPPDTDITGETGNLYYVLKRS